MKKLLILFLSLVLVVGCTKKVDQKTPSGETNNQETGNNEGNKDSESNKSNRKIVNDGKWDKLSDSELLIGYDGDANDKSTPALYSLFPISKYTRGGVSNIDTGSGYVGYKRDAVTKESIKESDGIEINTIDDINENFFYLKNEGQNGNFFSVSTGLKPSDQETYGMFNKGKENIKDLKIETIKIDGAKNAIKKFSFINTTRKGKELYFAGIINVHKVEIVKKIAIDQQLFVCVNENKTQKDYLLDLVEQFTQSITVTKIE